MGYCCTDTGRCWKHNHDPKPTYYLWLSNGAQQSMINETPMSLEECFMVMKEQRQKMPPHVCLYIEQRKVWVRHSFHTDVVEWARKPNTKRADDMALEKALKAAQLSVQKAIKKARTTIKDLRNNVKNLEEKKSKRGFKKQKPKRKNKSKKSPKAKRNAAP